MDQSRMYVCVFSGQRTRIFNGKIELRRIDIDDQIETNFDEERSSTDSKSDKDEKFPHSYSTDTEFVGCGDPLEMYAFSNGIAQSVKLAIWEATLEAYVTSIESLLKVML